MNDTRIKLAMIGCGLISAAHGIAARRSTYPISFTCCSSRSVESARSFAAEYGCDKFYVNHRELLDAEDIDGLVIATPPEVHAQIIQDCLAAGVKYILCEKPLTLTAAEAKTIAAAAQINEAIVLEGFMYRYHPQISRLLQMLKDGCLGQVDQLYCAVNMLDNSELSGDKLPSNWRRAAGSGGGVMHDFLCYPVDAANLCAGAEPCRAFARTFVSPQYGTIFRIFGLIEYQNGVLASVIASRMADFSQPLNVSCTHGSISLPAAFNPIGDTVIQVQRSHGLIATTTENVQIKVDPAVSERLLDLPVFTSQLEHFVQIIGSTAKPAITLHESIRNAAVRDALLESANSGSWECVEKIRPADQGFMGD